MLSICQFANIYSFFDFNKFIRLNNGYFGSILDFNVIKSRKVKEIMSETDRKYYCLKYPYIDAPQSIGNGVTISAPHMVCIKSIENAVLFVGHAFLMSVNLCIYSFYLLLARLCA